MAEKEQLIPPPVRRSRRWHNLLISGLILIGGVFLWVRDNPVFVDSSYYLMSGSLMRDGDLFLLDQEPKIADTELHLTPTGHLANPHFVGAALIAWPFLAWGQLLIPVLQPDAPDEWNASTYYGPPGRYRLAWYNASVVFCGLLFLIVMYRLCRKIGSGPVSLLAVVAVFFSTELWRMLWFTQGGSELVALCCISLLIGTMIRLGEGERDFRTGWLTVGLLLGFATLIRLQALVWTVLPLVCGLWWWKEDQIRGRGLFFSAVLSGFGFLLVVAVQVLILWGWWGVPFPDLYGAAVVRESLPRIMLLLRHYPEYLLLSLLPLAGVFGIFSLPCRLRAIGLGCLAVVIITEYSNLIRRGGVELQMPLNSRYCLVLTPIFMFGLTSLLNRLSRRARLAATLVLLLFSGFLFTRLFLSAPYTSLPDNLKRDLMVFSESSKGRWPQAEPLRGLALAGYGLAYTLVVPKSPLALGVAAALVPIVVGGMLLWRMIFSVGRGFRRRFWTPPAVVLVLLAGLSMLLILRVMGVTKAMVHRWDREERYHGSWRTLTFDWANCVDDLQMRARSYLEDGQYEEARRLMTVAMAIKPIPEGEVPDLPSRVREYAARRGHPGHVWQELCDRFCVGETVAAVTGVEYDYPEKAWDGNLGTIASAQGSSLRPGELVVELDPSAGSFSDVLAVFADPSVTAQIRVAVSSDGRNWLEPYRVEYWHDTIWIWDFYRRPWRHIRLQGLQKPADASLREVFAIMSPRHGVEPARGRSEERVIR